MSTPEFLPEDFLGGVFKYYGFNSSAFILFSGVILSGLGLSDILNPTIWLVSAVLALVVGYSLRHSISSNFPLTISLAFVASLLVVLMSIYLRSNPQLTQDYNRDPIAAILITSTPLFLLAFLFAVSLVSYKKHTVSIAETLLPAIQKQLYEQIINNPLYYSLYSVRVFLDFDEENNDVRLDTELTMVIANRKNERVRFPHRYPSVTPLFKLHEVRVDDKVRDIENPKHHAGDAVHLSDHINPKGSIKIDARMTEVFPENGSELYTCYNRPATAFEIYFMNQHSDKIQAWIEVLNNQDSETENRNGYITWISSGALLPNQGVRIVWKKRTV